MTPDSASADHVHERIHLIRGLRVLLDRDLAVLYDLPTSRLNEAVKRQRERFPEEFCFQLEYEEIAALRSQIAISKPGRGGRRYRPYVFTEHGALMAATVLNSPRAIQMSLVIIRAFVRLRQFMLDQRALAEKLTELDARVGAHDEQLGAIIEAIRQLTASPDPAHDRKIGFHAGNR